ncbi:MAG: ATP-binding protein [Anaerolineae bacterium]|nr:ATP-binding protein [Anaerolineae bacterium]
MSAFDQPYDLEQMFPRGRDSILADPADFRLGVVVGGSLSKGLIVKLDIGVPIEDLAVGRYVVVHGQHKRFFCMITDVVLDNTNPDIQSAPPDFSDPFLAEVYGGTAAYGKISVQPLLSIDEESDGQLGKPKPVKTIPGHFMPVFDATVQDVNAVFGPEDETHFNVGAPLELETTQINLDLKALVQRSIGVFGKSGTGKSFLTRMLLAGVIAKKQATALIFDMHNDYGWAAPDERGVQAKGLRQVLGSEKVLIYTLDPESSLRRDSKTDFDVKIGYGEIEPEDLENLRVSMNLSDAMLDAARMLRKEWGTDWIARLIDAGAMDFDAIEEDSPHRAGTLAALQRRLQRFERWGFLTRQPAADSVAQIMSALEQERSVVLEFGRYGNSLEAYMLVANFLTRRIHELYVERVEKALGDKAHEPPQLLIVIEEAHKFLDPKISNQTTFGVIAREMRKYKVTLLVVDQRPSGIDEEVMSQIGTRVTALLDNDRDITAVLMGISGAVALREVLSRLDTKQQVIIMGHAVPMPVVVKTRGYDQDFYDAISGEINGKGIGVGEGRAARKDAPRRLR